MRNTVLYSVMITIAAAVAMVSCTKDNDNDAPNDEPGIKTRLDQPKVTVVSSDATSFTVEWTEIENAVSYAYKINDGEETVTDGLTAEFTDLTPGIYTVQVKAMAAEDSEEYRDSNWGSVNHTVVMVIDLEELRSWIGTYEVTATEKVQFTWNDPELKDYINFSKLSDGEDTTFTITIEQNPGNEEILDVYGLSGLGAMYPAHATLVRAEDGSYALGIITNDPFVSGIDEDGALLSWLPIVEFEDGIVGAIQAEYSLMFVNNMGSIYSYPLTYSNIQGPGGVTTTAEVIATDIFGTRGTTVLIYYDSYPKRIPAGDFTLNKIN